MPRRTPRILRRSPLAIAIGSLLAVGTIQAAVITVDTTADGPVGSIPGCSLRSAVASANEGTSFDGCDPGSHDADQIVFDSGLSHSTITLSEGEIEIIQITGALTITGPVAGDPAGITIDGDGASRIFHITGNAPSDFEVGLDSLTLTGGRTTASNQQGGAILADDANLDLDHVLVTGNSTTGTYSAGGGLFVAGNVTLNNSTITGNSTTGNFAYGGGFMVIVGDTTLNNSTVSGNSTAGYLAHGGGLYVFEGDATLNNSTVSGNFAGGSNARGGGLNIAWGGVTLTHTTVAFNSALAGTDGVRRIGPGELTLKNSVVVQGGAGETACVSVTPITTVNSLATDESCTGSATDLADISLGPLADNGGPTRTHALVFPSVAINAAGDCNIEFGIDSDQRGELRPGAFSSACDIGAYEFQGEPEITLSTHSLDFGDGRVDSAAGPMSVTAENTGTADLEISGAGPIAGPDVAAFGISDDECSGATLPPAQTCAVELTFSPDRQGAFAAGFDFASNAPSSPDTVSLAGAGVASIIGVTPAMLDFGTVAPGSVGGPLELTIGNSGDDVLNVTGLSALAASFSISFGTCGAIPFSLPPGEDCMLSFMFAPTDSDPVIQTVIIDSDSFGGTGTFTLQGSATPPADDIFEDRFEAE